MRKDTVCTVKGKVNSNWVTSTDSTMDRFLYISIPAADILNSSLMIEFFKSKTFSFHFSDLTLLLLFKEVADRTPRKTARVKLCVESGSCGLCL